MLAAIKHTNSDGSFYAPGILLQYEDPKGLDGACYPPSAAALQHLRRLCLGAGGPPVYFIPIRNNKAASDNRKAVSGFLTTSGTLQFISEEKETSGELLISEFKAQNKAILQVALREGPVKKIPKVTCIEGKEERTASVPFPGFDLIWIKLENILRLDKNEANMLWTGSLVLQHAQQTQSLIAAASAYASGENEKLSELKLVFSKSLSKKRNSVLGAPTQCHSIFWVYYPEPKPANLRTWLTYFSTNRFDEKEVEELKQVLPTSGGFYRLSCNRMRKNFRLNYDDEGNLCGRGRLTFKVTDAGLENLRKSKFCSQDRSRAKLFSNFPVAVMHPEEKSTSHTAWGFYGIGITQWVFLLPYDDTHGTKTPGTYGPVRSAVSGPYAEEEARTWLETEKQGGSDDHKALLVDAIENERELLECEHVLSLFRQPEEEEMESDGSLSHSTEESNSRSDAMESSRGEIRTDQNTAGDETGSASDEADNENDSGNEGEPEDGSGSGGDSEAVNREVQQAESTEKRRSKDESKRASKATDSAPVADNDQLEKCVSEEERKRKIHDVESAESKKFRPLKIGKHGK